MLGDTQEKKATYYFPLIDEDGNGLIEASDFALRAHRLAESQDLREGDQREAIRQQVVAWWEHICTIADFDGDARVSFPEWKACWRSMQRGAKKGEPETRHTLEQSARSTLLAIDRGGTGRITSSEYADWLVAWGASGSAEAFPRLDRGEKGFLTEADVIVAVQEFYLSDDPEAPGNVLYGSLPD